jgi:hypothetical protein
VRTCTYCGTEEHRSIRCKFSRRTDYIAAAVYLAWAVVGIVVIAALSGCSVTVAPDTLCQLPRPVAALNDTDVTRTRQAKAAKAWDTHCTVRGWLTR